MAFHPRRLPEGFPASGTQSDDFFPPFFVFFWLFFLFYSGVGLGLFPLSGTGALFCFSLCSAPRPWGAEAAPGWGCFVSLANVVFSCTERHSNH